MGDEIEKPVLLLDLMPGSDEMTIAITGDGKLVRSAQQLEETIKVLIGLREMMSPAMPLVNPTKQTPVITTERMRWSAQTIPSKPGAVHLMVLHPGLGWIGMSIPQDGAQELAIAIFKCALPAGSGRPN